MATTTAPLMTVEEYLERPPREDGFTDELIEGEIVLSPNAKPSHSKVEVRLLKLLLPLQDAGFDIGVEFGCVLGPRSLPGPDLGAIKAERWASTGDDYLIGAPELVVEVFSPSNRKALMAQKAALYLRYGAEAVWVVYPKKRTVLVYEEDTATELCCGESLSFHGLTIPVDAIFEGL
jgi:Uma2 family endonuclease